MNGPANPRQPHSETAALTPANIDTLRPALLAMMREWSEDYYCAGWLIDLEARLHAEAGQWEDLGRLLGWPVGVDAEGGWETWDEAEARYKSPAWLAARPWLAPR